MRSPILYHGIRHGVSPATNKLSSMLKMNSHAHDILKSLLGKGYFPKELPPAFTTMDFGEHALEILADWEAANHFSIKNAKKFTKVDGKRLRGRYEYMGLKHAEPEVISIPKKLYERRLIHVTHPISQTLLVKELAENWRQLQRILSNRRYSEDKITIDRQHERSLEGINFELHHAKKDYIEATSDWLVRTDISRFYPSIYTHSIPWAAYGKEKVKSSLNRYRGSFADRLDMLVRACNRNQTIGIPIGPETSRIIAEIVSSRIDYEYKNILDPKLGTVARLQDDWFIGANSFEQAEMALSTISRCYREFGLEINGTKTSIKHILASGSESWKSEISGFLSHRYGGLNGQRLKELLNLCLRLQLDSPSEPVMNYTLAIIEGRRYRKFDVRFLESFLLKAATISPSSMDRICRIILNINYHTGGLSISRLLPRFAELSVRYFDHGALFEVIWLLYTIRGLNAPFKASRIIEHAENYPSSVIRILLFDMKNKGICLGKIPIKRWEDDVSGERVLTDWSWLYAYEAIRKGWMKDKRRLLSKPFFKAMDQRGINFYNPDTNIKYSSSVKKLQYTITRQQKLIANKYLNKLRNIDLSDYI